MSIFSTPFRRVTDEEGQPTQEPARRTDTIPVDHGDDKSNPIVNFTHNLKKTTFKKKSDTHPL